MREIGAFAAKNTLGALLDDVEHGEIIVITRHGRPVARLVPATGGVGRDEAKAAVDRMRLRAAELKMPVFRWEEVSSDREMGRP